ncbi:hypothetical protein PIB30_059690 [Stylosanthes scabra]|uniref:Uncharacterized protein n=1 Tax=Stylosanthes scabra TaxID=79078 RepID=A0ABU6RLF6_9FABA|nr:hypothetical protein [Stylosanthes scabra]
MEPCQQGYFSDSSNDSYFSCEESLSVHQLDQAEPPYHLLTVITRLANQVIQSNPSRGLAFKDALDAVTLRSRTQLKELPMPDPVAQAPPKKDTKIKRDSEEPVAAQIKVITNSTELTTEEVPHLPPKDQKG